MTLWNGLELPESYFHDDNVYVIKGDCLEVLPYITPLSVDLVVADPPFNIGKRYAKHNDNQATEDYYAWCFAWLDACSSSIKYGGQIWVHHIPIHAITLSEYLKHKMTFQNWVAIKFESGITHPSNLNPLHYVMLRFSKGKPNTFDVKADLSPHKYCRHCGGLIADWGGKEKYRNKEGKRLSDVWDDINRIKHKKNKHVNQNELPLKLIERCVKLTTISQNVVLDPFLGSGTTMIACSGLSRKCIGIESSEENCELATIRYLRSLSK